LALREPVECGVALVRDEQIVLIAVVVDVAIRVDPTDPTDIRSRPFGYAAGPPRIAIHAAVVVREVYVRVRGGQERAEPVVVPRDECVRLRIELLRAAPV